MKQLVRLEDTRVGKKALALITEQPEGELYQLAPAAASLALAKNQPVIAPMFVGMPLGLALTVGLGVELTSIPGNPYNLGADAKGATNGLAGMALLVVGILPGILSFGVCYLLQNKVRRPNHLLADRLKKRVHTWAKRRYGVELDEAALGDGLLSFLSRKQEVGAFYFLTAQGRQFKLVAGQHGYYLEEHREGAGEHAPLGSIAAIERAKGTDILALGGEARVLAQQIEQQLATLENRSLSTEANYSLNRAKQDFQQALALNAQLLELGEVRGEEAALLAETLSTLTAELSAIIAQEREQAVRQLRVQRNYVRERQQPLVSKHLTLAKVGEIEARVLAPAAPSGILKDDEVAAGHALER